MATLKASDILADLTDDSEKPTSARPRRTPGASPSLEERKVKAAAAAHGKPSPYASDLRAKLRQKTQLNFGESPYLSEMNSKGLQRLTAWDYGNIFIISCESKERASRLIRNWMAASSNPCVEPQHSLRPSQRCWTTCSLRPDRTGGANSDIDMAKNINLGASSRRRQ